MGFYTSATIKALESAITEDNIRMMYYQCITYYPGDFVHRVLLYEDGGTNYHRIKKGSTELADIQNGKAVVAVQTLEFNKEEVADVEAFVANFTKSALNELRNLING
ncbi:hypothetical protein [Paenibacillus sp. MMS20-IR301]|uniref:hypothetical protein n=1 Tax=Paenibacillus sp. MMS20-IR301 TaxID=2895946 RepID=UPI0028EADE5D|nr:hypothetical protein [Paenibacillus sp. MMS20-IR301]WNS42067.1 hypothetical protein LOS79_24100 [Paenibacillus sp. MMS20-IR301]